MSDLLDEYDNTFDTSGIVDSTVVQGRNDGKNIKIPDYILNYRHPDKPAIDKLKERSK